MVFTNVPCAFTNVPHLMRKYALFRPRSHAVRDVDEIALVAAVHVAAVGDAVWSHAETLAPGFGDVVNCDQWAAGW